MRLQLPTIPHPDFTGVPDFALDRISLDDCFQLEPGTAYARRLVRGEGQPQGGKTPARALQDVVKTQPDATTLGRSSVAAKKPSVSKYKISEPNRNILREFRLEAGNPNVSWDELENYLITFFNKQFELTGPTRTAIKSLLRRSPSLRNYVYANAKKLVHNLTLVQAKEAFILPKDQTSLTAAQFVLHKLQEFMPPKRTRHSRRVEAAIQELGDATTYRDPAENAAFADEGALPIGFSPTGKLKFK